MEDEDYKHSQSGEVSDRSKNQCHIINNLLTSLARGRTVKYCIGLVSFCTDLGALGPYCQDLGPIFPSTASRSVSKRLG